VRAIRVIWASAVCNLDQNLDRLSYGDYDLDQALVFCKNRTDVGSSTVWYKNSVTLSLFVFEFALGRGRRVARNFDRGGQQQPSLNI